MPSGVEQLKRLFFAIVVALWGGLLPASSEPHLVRTSNVTWELPERWFGGFSGMEMAKDGQTLTLITDRGQLVIVALRRSKQQITSLRLLRHRPLLHANGSRLKGGVRDAEGLAIAADGSAFVSFEFRHRVVQLDLGSGHTSLLPAHKDFSNFPTNNGMEALAIHPDGRLFTLPEALGNDQKSVPLYVFEKGRWGIVHQIPSLGAFRPVGADFDDQGRLYLLERAVTLLGFQSRIRRMTIRSDSMSQEVLLTTLPGTYDNLEALSVWLDAEGKTRLTLISDDNFLPFQTTQIVEYRLTE